MNSLIIFPEELISPTEAHIKGDRAEYIKTWHDLKNGVTIKAGIWSGARGTATVVEIDRSTIVLKVNCVEEPLKRSDTHLIVAIPRPQTIKKVIQAATAFGISEVYFVKSSGVAPGYEASTSLKPEAVQLEIVKALEQCCDTIPPQISVHRNWNYFVQNDLRSITDESAVRLIAHTTTLPGTQRKDLTTKEGKKVFAIGPESGWTEEEVILFIDNEFDPVSLGERMLRVEHAVVKMIASG